MTWKCANCALSKKRENEKFVTGCCPLAMYCETCYPKYHLKRCPFCTYKVPETAGKWADTIAYIHGFSDKLPRLVDKN